MPLYEYECDACHHRFEKIQKFSDPPVDKCPKCGGPVHKLQSAPAFQLKGTGWYITDYAKKDHSSGKSESKTSESAAKTEKTEKSEKTEKPAEKPAAAKSESPTKTKE